MAIKGGLTFGSMIMSLSNWTPIYRLDTLPDNLLILKGNFSWLGQDNQGAPACT